MIVSSKTGAFLEEYTRFYNDCEKKSYIDFTNDGKFSAAYYEKNYKGECVLDSENRGNGTYSFNSTTNILSVNVDKENNNVKVREITDKVLAIEFDAEGDYDGDGFDDIFVEYFKK